MIQVILIERENNFYAIGDATVPNTWDELSYILEADVLDAIDCQEFDREYIVKIKLMTEEEFNSLPKFEGW